MASHHHKLFCPLLKSVHKEVDLCVAVLFFYLLQLAVRKDVRVLMDAEQTYYQPAIRNFMVHCMMKHYNKEKPVLYDTVQSYLKVINCDVLCL